ncbi:MAG: acetylglutamate kinase [Deltaproteobacteria bacterium]|nr:acetylglutamate kinase [Deltaproteobacteria bacterium]
MSMGAANVVIKLGGELLEPKNEAELRAVTGDVRSMLDEGVLVTVVHGGGPQTTALAKRLGQTPNVVAGRRITDAAALETLLFAVAGKLNVLLVGAFQRAGISAVGLSGVSARLIECTRRPPRVVAGGGPDPIDFGHVGDVVAVNVDLLRCLQAAGYLPVLACIGGDAAGQPFNINADIVANDIAMALGADDLMLITSAPGVLRSMDNLASRIPTLSVAEARRAIDEGVVQGGMIPKLEESFRAIEAGVGSVHILGQLAPGDLVRARAQPGTVGTRLT